MSGSACNAILRLDYFYSLTSTKTKADQEITQ